MFTWCVYIKSINLEVRHILGEKNAIANMLSRARCEDEEVGESDNEEEGQSTLAINAIRGGEEFKEKEFMKNLKRLGSIYKRCGKKEPRDRKTT